ncbi:unnamed protein product [Sphenostylis stenocarpa]|uniref:Uncharacterized protein n=1 Tax=Sphenostylis stenocarpa TaxID=92480 RepID=A0AA87B7L1_9FABA|nr:unnamed protein product [Sphenostylis stenocarpa]
MKGTYEECGFGSNGEEDRCARRYYPVLAVNGFGEEVSASITLNNAIAMCKEKYATACTALHPLSESSESGCPNHETPKPIRDYDQSHDATRRLILLFQKSNGQTFNSA